MKQYVKSRNHCRKHKYIQDRRGGVHGLGFMVSFDCWHFQHTNQSMFAFGVAYDVTKKTSWYLWRQMCTNLYWVLDLPNQERQI